MKGLVLWGFISVLALRLTGVSSVTFSVEPRRVTLRPGQPATILCRSSVPLTRCRFLLQGDTVVDLSRGARTPATPEYKYYGRGLESGQCGITLTAPQTGFGAVACQGWAEREGWMRAAMFLRVTTLPTLQWELEPRHALVLPGEDVNFLCRSRLALTECRVGLMNEDRWINLNQGAQSGSTSEYRYLGGGLERGECGITLLKIKEDMSGEVRCVGISNTRWAGDFMTLVVAKTPDPPVLDVQHATELKDGDVMEVTCAVRNGRPAANITWYMDGKPLTEGLTDESPADVWFDYEVQTRIQRLRKRIGHHDNGKEIKCMASHIALFDYVNQDTKHINVKFKPLDLVEPIQQSNLIIGRRGLIIVEVSANPQPLFTWSVGNDVFQDDDTDETANYKAEPAIKKGLGKWEARFHIKSVSADDLTQRYLLKARNQMGSNTYTIPLSGSTMTGQIGLSNSIPTPGGHAPQILPAPQVTSRPRPTTIKQDAYCGRALQANQLIVKGNTTAEGEWPWIVALFAKRVQTAGLQFHCGATLINTRYVVTAAHCMQPSKTHTLSTNDIVAYFGKYSLDDWAESNTQVKKVSAVHVHPDYEVGMAGKGSDVAVLKLAAPVTVNRYVRPICLWNKDSALERVVGQIGVVVGWGRYGVSDRFVSDVPLMASAAIVSQEECLRSNADFYHFTSDRTLCAGHRDGGGPCNGDSGSGLVLPYEVNNRTQWFLRGVVSLSLTDRATSSCDLQQYVIYTDMAQFSNWVAQYAR